MLIFKCFKFVTIKFFTLQGLLLITKEKKETCFFTSSASTNALNCSCRLFNVPNCSKSDERLSDGTLGLSADGDRLPLPGASYTIIKRLA